MEAAQSRRVGGADVHFDTVHERLQPLDALCRLLLVESGDAHENAGRHPPQPFQARERGLQPIAGEAQRVDGGLTLGEPQDARFRVAGARLRRHGAADHVPEAERSEAVQAGAVLIESRSEPNRIPESDAADRRGQVHLIGRWPERSPDGTHAERTCTGVDGGLRRKSKEQWPYGTSVGGSPEEPANTLAYGTEQRCDLGLDLADQVAACALGGLDTDLGPL